MSRSLETWTWVFVESTVLTIITQGSAMSVLGRFDCLSVLGTPFIHLHWPEIVTFLDRCIGVPNPELSEQIHST